jgi:peptide deformylase
MILKTRILGEPVLREPARPLKPKELLSKETQELIDSMRETMRDAPGVGLAAPQVGLSLQLAVIEDCEEYVEALGPERAHERERKPVPFHVIVNPVLTLDSEPDVEFFEGCLSMPGFTAVVPRARSVRVECLDHRGKSRLIQATGWYARILQHEIDHLTGVLYIDRMRSSTLSSLENLNRYWKEKSVAEAVAHGQKSSRRLKG